MEEKDFPGLYRSSDALSIKMQKEYYFSLASYSVLLLTASLFSFLSTEPDPSLKIISAVLFLASLAIMIWQKTTRPDDLWYNGRAVAESVKTRTWRFIMKAVPYEGSDEIARQNFVEDLKEILKSNESVVRKLGTNYAGKPIISDKMKTIRNLSLAQRVAFYHEHRINDQEKWYCKKAAFNKSWSTRLFWVSIALHALATFFLLYNIKEPAERFPVSVIGVAASAILSWLQAKKYNELSSSYSLTAHEIALIKNENDMITNEQQFSEYIINCETAFSREHTQWIARKKR